MGNIARRYDSLSVEGLQTNVQSVSVAGRMRVKGDISVTRFSHVEYFLSVAFGMTCSGRLSVGDNGNIGVDFSLLGPGRIWGFVGLTIRSIARLGSELIVRSEVVRGSAFSVSGWYHANRLEAFP